MLIEVLVSNQCSEDQILTDYTADTVSYDIGMTGEVLIAPEWQSNSVDERCLSEYKLFILEASGEQRDLTPEEAYLITQDTSNGSIRIENKNFFDVGG